MCRSTGLEELQEEPNDINSDEEFKANSHVNNKD